MKFDLETHKKDLATFISDSLLGEVTPGKMSPKMIEEVIEAYIETLEDETSERRHDAEYDEHLEEERQFNKEAGNISD